MLSLPGTRPMMPNPQLMNAGMINPMMNPMMNPFMGGFTPNLQSIWHTLRRLLYTCFLSVNVVI